MTLVTVGKRRASYTPATAALALVAAAGCTRGDPPAPATAPSIATVDPVLLAPQAPARDFADAAPTVTAAARPTAELPDPSPSPSSRDAPSRDSQTRDRPTASGAAFDGRVRALWNAIVTGEPDTAMPFFFPVTAYEQVKDVGDPEADWKHRLVAAYRRDVLALHARLGDAAGRAELASLDVPSAQARWIEPGEEWNKLGYFRVFGSRLRYTVDGNEHAFDVKSLISWRGEWYVVHLSAIK